MTKCLVITKSYPELSVSFFRNPNLDKNLIALSINSDIDGCVFVKR